MRMPSALNAPVVAGAVLVGAVIGAASMAGLLPSRLALAQCQAQTAELRAAAQAASAQSLATTLQAERHQRAAADTIQSHLTDALQGQRMTAQERRHAVSASRDGSVCLRDPVVRLLDGSPGLRVEPVRDPLPHGPSGPDAPHAGAATAAREMEATDREVGAWMIDAAASYEECRSRLHALIDFVESAAAGRSAP